MKSLINRLYYKIPMLLLGTVLLLAVSIQEEQLFGWQYFSGELSAAEPVKFPPSIVKQIFPDAVRCDSSEADNYKIYGVDNTFLGILINSSPSADGVWGYAGRVPLLIALDGKGIIKNIQLLKNYESGEYINHIHKAGYLEHWIGDSVHTVLTKEIDAVSGATETSVAIKKNIQLRIAQYLNSSLADEKTDYWLLTKRGAGIFVLIFALASFLFPRKTRRLRIFLLLSTIVLLGFLNGSLLSVFLFKNIMVLGIPIDKNILLLIIIVTALFLPLLTDKKFYCSYLCPFGASQELLGNIPCRKLHINRGFHKKLLYIREAATAVILVVLLLGIKLDLALIEPFPFFNIQTGSLTAISLASFFLILSVFIDKPWCRYFCPTGFLLDFLRIKKNKGD